MKSLQAEYDEASKNISIKKGAKQEDWVIVCQQFNDDVARICDVTKVKDFRERQRVLDVNSQPLNLNRPVVVRTPI